MRIDDPDMLAAAMPFAEGCGVKIEYTTPDEIRGTLAWDLQRCTADGVLHGGALMTLADSAGAVCAYANLPPGATTSTIASSVSFLRPVRGGAMTAVSRPLHTGRSVIAVRGELFDDDGRLVAHVVQHQAVHRTETREGVRCRRRRS